MPLLPGSWHHPHSFPQLRLPVGPPASPVSPFSLGSPQDGLPCWPRDTHTPAGTSLCPTPRQVCSLAPSTPASLISTAAPVWSSFLCSGPPSAHGLRPLPPPRSSHLFPNRDMPKPLTWTRVRRQLHSQSCRARLGDRLLASWSCSNNPFCILGPGRVLNLEGAPGPFFCVRPQPGTQGARQVLSGGSGLGSLIPEQTEFHWVSPLKP